MSMRVCTLGQERTRPNEGLERARVERATPDFEGSL